MIVWMIYEEKDYENNPDYVRWFTEEGKKIDIEIKLILRGFLDITINDGKHEFIYKDKKLKRPDAVINRTRDWKIAYILESADIRVFNKSQVNMLANDKLLSYSKASSLGMDVLYTDTISKIEENYVYKSRDGHGGKEVFLSNKENMDHLSKIAMDDYIRQEVSQIVGKDLRVYIMAGEILVCILRSSSEDFRSNFKLGGNIEKYQLNSKQKESVMKLVKSMDLDYVGIDFLLDKNENLVFNEIEDPVGSRMVSEIAPEINIGKEFLAYIRNDLKKKNE